MSAWLLFKCFVTIFANFLLTFNGIHVIIIAHLVAKVKINIRQRIRHRNGFLLIDARKGLSRHKTFLKKCLDICPCMCYNMCMACNNKKLTSKEVIARINKLPGDYNFSKFKYINSRTPVTLICEDHGEFQMAPLGRGCRLCQYFNGGNICINIHEYIYVANKRHKGKYDYSLLTARALKQVKILVICEKHGEFQIRKSAHIAPKQLYGCQKCGKPHSKGEESIKYFLEQNNIMFEAEKTFEDLLSFDWKTKLRYDFFLPKENILIEFDGRHHFHPTKYGKKDTDIEQKLRRTHLLDLIKNSYAIEYGYNMVRISYDYYSHIDKILEQYVMGENHNLVPSLSWGLDDVGPGKIHYFSQDIENR